jgi:beta-galactosidase/beta-glucuronidase
MTTTMVEQREILHPRPQLTRPQWLDLQGSWDFTYDEAGQGLDEDWYERADVYGRVIQVPFPPESSASGIGDSSFHPIMWYRRTFQVPHDYAGKRLLLHCGAVDYRASVWVNGRHVITHEGGQTPFSVDITNTLFPGQDQVLVIRAEDIPMDLAQPRGKQDWQEHPHRIWYHRTSGVWQPVWIEPVAPTHITGVRWTPDLDRGVLGLNIKLQHPDGVPVRIRVRISLHNVVIADDVYLAQGTEVQRQIALDRGVMMNRDELLWSPAHPNLIEATITLIEGDTGSEIIDEVQSYVGLRSVRVDDGRFLLNGRPYYLRLVLEQGYWPETHLAAPSDESMRREVELAKSLGFNGMRIHQKVEDPRFLYWCDRLGLLVWGEMANAYIFSPIAMQRLTREWLDVLERDYNHPCIVAWVPLNESWGVPNVSRDAAQRHFVQSLYHLTKAFDQTRPVIGNDGWEHLISDIYSVHDYSFDGQTLRERYGSPEAVERTLREVQPGYHSVALPGYHRTSEPIMLSEFGGISSLPNPDVPWFGYGTVTNSDAFLSKYRELVDAILESPAIAGFCYTQLTDTEQETNGLLTSNREPKLDPAAIRTITSRSSAAVPADEIAQMQKEQDITAFAGFNMDSTAKSNLGADE